MQLQAIWLIAKSVLIEAVRRREIYAIVLVSTLVIGAVMTVDFFGLEGITKFYREFALKVMSVATALTVIVLAGRQLPREFESRTIYPLMAKPISRLTFLLGKLLGVMLAAAFCFALFMAVYLVGAFWLGGEVPWLLFLQFIYLQMVMMLLLATLSFWLSMVLNFDAAITVGVLLYGFAATFTSMVSFLYDFVERPAQLILQILTFVIPQLTLFDLSEKAVHADQWAPIPAGIMGMLTVYGGIYIVAFFAFAMVCFRRRAL